MEPFEDDSKKLRVRRTTTVGPNFGAVKLMEHTPVDSGVTVGTAADATEQPSVKLHVSSRFLPMSLFPTHNNIENDVPEVDPNLNIVNKMIMKTEILCCNYTENYEYVVIGSIDGTVRIYKSGHLKEHLFTLMDEETAMTKAAVTSINYRPVNNGHPQTNSILCTYIDGHIKCWNYMHSQCLYSINEKGHTYGLTYHKREPKFITFGDKNKLLLYDEETRVLERIFYDKLSKQSEIDLKDSRILASCFHPRSNHIVLAASGNDVVTFWDARMPTSFRKIIGPHIVGNGLDIHRRRNEILTCSWRKENQIQLWDFDSGKLISVVEPDNYQTNLYCGVYFANELLVTGGIDPNLFRIIDMRTRKNMSKIINLPGGVYNFDIGWSKDNISSKMKPRIVFCCGKKLYEVDILDYELSL